VNKISLLTIKLPQKATDDFMDILRKRKEALSKVAGVNIEYDEEKTREAVLKSMNKLFFYATGWKNYPEQELTELIEDIIAMVYMGKGFPTNKNVFWKAWMRTSLGYLIRMTIARMKYNRKENMSALELAILSGTNPSNVTHLIKRGTISAIKDGISSEWIIPYEEAEKYLEEKRMAFTNQTAQ